MHKGKKVWCCGDCANKGIEYRTFQRSNMKVSVCCNIDIILLLSRTVDSIIRPWSIDL